MADTRRTLAALQALLADNTSGDISAQDIRDFLVTSVWGLVGSWTFSINVTELLFDVSTATEFMVVVDRVTLGTSGRLTFSVSVDGGATYFTSSGDYVSLAITGIATNTTSVANLTSADATAARSGVWFAPAAGVNGGVKVIQNLTRVPTDNASLVLFLASTSPITNIRVFPNNGGNITGGSVYVFGR